MNVEARLAELIPARHVEAVADAVQQIATRYPDDTGAIALNSTELGRVDLIVTCTAGKVTALDIVPSDPDNDTVLEAAKLARREATS